MKYFSVLLIFIFALSDVFGGEPSKTYLVANSNDQKSVELAKDYAQKRNVPERNIIALNLPRKQYIAAEEYFEKFENPLMDELIKLGALKGEKKDSKIFEGRNEIAFVSHDIDYIILFRGVPVGINPSENKSGAKTDASTVDSELSARFAPMQSRDGFIKNPLFGAFKQAGEFKKIGLLRVFRIDAPTFEGAKKIAESSMRVELKGLRGRAYVDKSQFVKEGDSMLDKTAEILEKLNFDISVDSEKPLFDFDKRMDAAAFYFGWYSYSVDKYFADKTFRMPEGAIAVHIFSFSARDMRTSRNWTPRFAELGASFAAGNVFEPYLYLTHNTSALALAFAQGLETGEAAYAAQPALSWQTINVGDPLCRPMKHGLAEQLKDIERGDIDELSQYCVIRAMNTIQSKKGAAAAIALGEYFLPKLKYKYALDWKLSQVNTRLGALNKALAYAQSASNADLYKHSDLHGLAFEIADYLSQNGKADIAVNIFEKLAKTGGDMKFAKVLISHANKVCEKFAIEMPETLKELKIKLEKYEAEQAAKARSKNNSKSSGKSDK